MKRYSQSITRVALLLLVAALLMPLLSSPKVQASSKGDGIPDLRQPLQDWNDAQLEQFVEAAIGEKISVPEAQHVWDRLTPAQKKRVGELLAINVGIPVDEWQRFVTHNAEYDNNTKESRVFGYPGEIWREPIENTWTWGYPPGTTFASSYWNSPLCDDDPNDPDWTFYFYQSYEWYSRDPDGLRWTSDSTQVYLAFMAAYGGNLNGYAFTWNEARLCIGTNGVTAAGGPDNVKNNLFLSPNH